MLRRSLSLAFPLMLSAVAALSFVHFRRAPEVAAAPPVQLAQADPADPFAPPADPPPVKPVAPKPVAPPADPLAPPAKVRKQRVRRAVPQSDDEVRSPLVRSLLGQLGSFSDINDEDRNALRRELYEADVEMSESMGPNARRKIESINRKPGFTIGSPGPRTARDSPRTRAEALQEIERRKAAAERRPVAPKADPFKDDPAPADPVPPKKDIFDDL